MPSKPGSKKGGPPLQTPLLRFTTRSALAFDLAFNLHKTKRPCKGWLEKMASVVQNLTSPIRPDVPGRDNFGRDADSPNISKNRNEPGTAVGHAMHLCGTNAVRGGARGLPP